MLGYVTFDTANDRIPPALGQTKKPGWWFDVPTPRPSPTNPPRNIGYEVFVTHTRFFELR